MLDASVSASATAASPARRLHAISIEPFVFATSVALVVGTGLRLKLGAGRPLWLDETFTGAIAAQPNLGAVGRQILDDVNAPLYYLIAHAWSLGFGLSNAALRFPAFAFSVAAPFLCLVPTTAIARRTRLIWCMLVALWGPGLPFAQEARCYSLVFCLVVGLTVAFASFLRAPSPRRALLWATLGCLAVLAHYDALVLVGLQGLAGLAMFRRRALAYWCAALPFLLLAGWMAIASDRIRAFTANGVAWYHRMQVGELWDVWNFVTGAGIAVALWLALFGGLTFVEWRRGRIKPSKGGGRAAAVAALTAMAATVLLVGLAFVKATFTMRYLMVLEPGLLLGLAVIAEALRRVCWAAPAVLIAFVAETSLVAAATGLPPKAYNFEIASDALIADGTRSLAFFWDNPDNAVEAPSQLAIVGGFFFHRQGLDVDVEPLLNPRGSDPNPRLLALARGPRPAILWLYDTRIHDTAAVAFPPRIAETPGWRCRDFGSGPIGVLACTRPS